MFGGVPAPPLLAGCVHVLRGTPPNSIIVFPCSVSVSCEGGEKKQRVVKLPAAERPKAEQRPAASEPPAVRWGSLRTSCRSMAHRRTPSSAAYALCRTPADHIRITGWLKRSIPCASRNHISLLRFHAPMRGWFTTSRGVRPACARIKAGFSRESKKASPGVRHAAARAGHPQGRCTGAGTTQASWRRGVCAVNQ